MPRGLQVIEGADKGRFFPLSEGIITIGSSRKHADIPLNDIYVARIHCEIEVDGNRLVVSDSEDSAGTLVNGQKVKRQELQAEDVLRVGNTQFRVQLDSAGETDEGGAAPEGGAKIAQLPAEQLDELAGTTLGHYAVGPVLGKGHCSLVFRARELKGDKVVALKVLYPEFPKGDEEMQRFAQALKTALPLRHPNLVTVYAAGKSGPYCWVALELVEGETLRQVFQRLATAGPPDWKQAFRVAVHVGRALHYAGLYNLIHRNLTPQNILVRTTDNLTKLGDLALAKALGGSTLKQVTMRAKVQTDLFYLAPEQTHPSGGQDSRSDLYSLGTIVYTLLAGRPPVAGKSQAEVVAQIRDAEPAKPRQWQPSLPEAFEAAVLKLLAKKPEDRYQTPAELLADLAKVSPDHW
jgi:serine/threonine protein kinase